MSHKNPTKVMTETLDATPQRNNLGFNDGLKKHANNTWTNAKSSPSDAHKKNTPSGATNKPIIEANIKRKNSLLPSIVALTALQKSSGSIQQKLSLLNEALAAILCDIDQLHNFDYLFDGELIDTLNEMHSLTTGDVPSAPHHKLLAKIMPDIIVHDVAALKTFLCIVHDLKLMTDSRVIDGFFYFQLPRAKMERLAEKHEEIYTAGHLKTRMILKRKLCKILKEELGCTLCLPISLANCKKFLTIANKYYSLAKAIAHLSAIEQIQEKNALPDDQQEFFANNNIKHALLYNLAGFSKLVKKLPIAYLQENFSYMPWAALDELGTLWAAPLTRVNNKGFDIRFFVHNANKITLQKINCSSPELSDINWNALIDELTDIKAILQRTQTKLYKRPDAVFLEELAETQAPSANSTNKLVAPPYVFWHRSELEAINNSCFAFMLSVAEWKKVLDGRGLFTNDMYNMVVNLLQNVSDKKERRMLMKIMQIEEESLAYHVRRWGKKLPQDDASVLRFVQTVIQAYPESRDKWREHFTGHNRKMQLDVGELADFKENVSNDNSLSEYIDDMISQLKPSPHQQLHNYISKLDVSNQEIESAEIWRNIKELFAFCRSLLFQAATDGKAHALTKIISLRLLKSTGRSVPLLFDNLLPTDYQDLPHQYNDVRTRIYSSMADYLINNSTSLESLLYSLNTATVILSEIAYEYFNTEANAIEFNKELNELKYLTMRLHLAYQASLGNSKHEQILNIMVGGEALENLAYIIEKLDFNG